MTDGTKRVERVVELLVYAPIGASLCAIDMAPSLADRFVNRARQELDRRHDEVRRHVTTVRSMGQVAVAFGVPMVRRRASSVVADPRPARANDSAGAEGRTRDAQGAPADPDVTVPEQRARQATSCRFPATTHYPHRRSSSDSRGSLARSSTQCTHTRPRIANAAPSWARSSSSPADVEAARAARNSDLPALVRLARDARRAATAAGRRAVAPRDARPEPLETEIGALLERAGLGVFVGTIDDAVVGFATVEVQLLRDGTRLGVVRDLFVEPEGARGRRG